jgi:stearoyl-CoA desaturase (delta-9 desaturase)
MKFASPQRIRQSFNTRDRSANLWPLALISLGDSWHNNHHAWPSAAISGIGPWQIDPSGALIRLLEFCGLARDVKRPGAESIAQKRGGEIREQ